MRSTLYPRFILLYIIFGFLGFFTCATLGRQLILNQLESDASNDLYRQATLVSDDYLPDYFSGELSARNVTVQLNAMQDYLDASVWFVDEDGHLISSATPEEMSAPHAIANFDPAEMGANQSITGTYHGYFSEEVLTVISPVINGFTTEGYLMIHQPYAVIEELCRQLMGPVYLVMSVVFVLSFILLLGFHFMIYRPLRQVTEAATEYAAGNLDYEIPIQTQDEIGYLSASLNYMSSQLRDMEDYEKKIVANVSHDFRSPLTSISGYVTAMSDGTIPPEMYGKYLNIIQFETERLTDLTNDLLTLNEFDTKEIFLNKTSFDIQTVIEQTATSFEGTCTERKITIELLRLPEDVYVFADESKIRQVLYNLIDNAIKFSENESTVTIETSWRNDKIYISVRDTGIGIPRKDINKIWERFYKSDLSRGRDKKGTGLGLSIVREIIQAHGEYLNVVSTEGVGTEFTFSLTPTEDSVSSVIE